MSLWIRFYIEVSRNSSISSNALRVVLLLLLEESWIFLKSALEKKERKKERNTILEIQQSARCASTSRCPTWSSTTRFLEVIPARVRKCQSWKGPEGQLNSTLPFYRWGKSGPSDSVCPRSHGQPGLPHFLTVAVPVHFTGPDLHWGRRCVFSIQSTSPSWSWSCDNHSISQLPLIKHKQIAWHLGCPRRLLFCLSQGSGFETCPSSPFSQAPRAQSPLIVWDPKTQRGVTGTLSDSSSVPDWWEAILGEGGKGGGKGAPAEKMWGCED